MAKRGTVKLGDLKIKDKPAVSEEKKPLKKKLRNLALIGLILVVAFFVLRQRQESLIKNDTSNSSKTAAVVEVTPSPTIKPTPTDKPVSGPPLRYAKATAILKTQKDGTFSINLDLPQDGSLDRKDLNYDKPNYVDVSFANPAVEYSLVNNTYSFVLSIGKARDSDVRQFSEFKDLKPEKNFTSLYRAKVIGKSHSWLYLNTVKENDKCPGKGTIVNSPCGLTEFSQDIPGGAFTMQAFCMAEDNASQNVCDTIVKSIKFVGKS